MQEKYDFKSYQSHRKSHINILLMQPEQNEIANANKGKNRSSIGYLVVDLSLYSLFLMVKFQLDSNSKEFK